MGHHPTRRLLLQGGSLLVGFALFGRAASAAFTAGGPKDVAADEVNSFLAIGADGQVTAFSGKVDLGTGVRTALTQIAADELDVPLARVTIAQGDTLLALDQRPTYGSLSIQAGGMQRSMPRRRPRASAWSCWRCKSPADR